MTTLLATQKPIRIERSPDALELHICWSLWNTCNYSCSYCPSFNFNGSHQWLTLKMATEFVSRLRAHYMEELRLTKVQISFTGGEPTLHRDFKALCFFIAEQGMTMGLTSNGSAGPRYWQDFASFFDWINFSYHPASVNDERFFSVLRQLHDDPRVPVPAVRFLMHPEPVYWEKCLAFAHRMKAEFANWVMEFVEIQNDFGVGITPVRYSQEQVLFLREHAYAQCFNRTDLAKPAQHRHHQTVLFDSGGQGPLRTNELVNQDLVDFFGWECRVGLESLYIDYDGNVYRSGCKQGGPLGNLHQPERIAFPREPLICALSRCICGTDIMVSKKLIQKEAKHGFDL